MKILIYLIISLVFYSCIPARFEDNLEKIATKNLNDSTVVELLYGGGGATDIDVIWVAKIVKNKQHFIGKIKWPGTDWYKADISQISDSLIKIRFTDTLHWKGTITEFKINTQNTIKPNDGSMYADSTY